MASDLPLMRWSPFALAILSLAGCAGGGDAPVDAVEDPTDGLDLKPTATTGILRGVVVDDAVRPIVGVQVSIAGPTPANATTTDAGAFGFQGLEPGTYFVSASKMGFGPQQTSAEVVAGEDEPPLVRIQLVADPSTQPFAESHVFEGYTQCSVSIVLVGFAACSTLPGGVGQDNFDVEHELSRSPDWLQSEMVWDSTQALSDGMSMSYSASGEDALLTNWANTEGPSPLLIQTNRTLNDEWIGNGSTLYIRTFNAPIPGTRPPDPVNGDACVDRPVLGGCLTGVGITVQQRFTIFTHAFYGYTPDPSWRFSIDGVVPQPA